MRRAQRVVINGVTSGWQPVTSEVMQGQFSSMFVCFINTSLNCILSKFVANAKLRVDSPKGREPLQRDFDVFQDWTITKHMKFRKNKCSILPPGSQQPWIYAQTGRSEAGRQPHGKGSGGSS